MPIETGHPPMRPDTRAQALAVRRGFLIDLAVGVAVALLALATFLIVVAQSPSGWIICWFCGMLSFGLTVATVAAWYFSRRWREAVGQVPVLIRRIAAAEDEAKRLHHVIDALPVRVFWKNRESVFLGCNRAFAADARLLKPSRIAGLTDYDLPISRKEADAFRQDDAEVVGTGEPTLHIVEPLHEGQPDEIWIEISRMPLVDERERVVGVVGMFDDVTARHRLENELRRIQAALEDASDAIVTTDRHHKIDFINVAFMDVFRHTLTTVNEAGIDSIFASPDDAETVYRAVNGFENWTGELSMRSRDGRDFPVLLRATPILNEHIEIIGALIVINDITERKHLERQLLQAQKLESIGQLAAGIAHEINTPIQYIGDNARFLQDCFRDLQTLVDRYHALAEQIETGVNDPRALAEIENYENEIDVQYLTAEIPRAVQQSLEGIDHVARILRAMKNFSHPGVEEKTAIDLNDAIASTVTIARSAWKYVADVHTDFDETLPLVPCLPGEINQVVLNLIINASHTISEKIGENPTEKGSISIATRHDEKWAEIRIADTGQGIPEAIQNRIFDPFFTTKDVGKGTGQGLAISHGAIVDKHGGELTFETKMGEGSTFIIRLPLQSSHSTNEKVAMT